MKSEENIKINLKLYEQLKHHMDHGATYLEALNLIKTMKDCNPVRDSLYVTE